MRTRYPKTSSLKKIVITKTKGAWIITFMLLAAQIFLAIQTSTMGAELSYLEHEQNNIRKENHDLQVRLVTESSLSKVEENSLSLGFTSPKHILFVKHDESVAQLR